MNLNIISLFLFNASTYHIVHQWQSPTLPSFVPQLAISNFTLLSIVTLSQFDLHSILKLQFRGTHLNLFISYWTLTHIAKWPSNTHWIFAHSLVNVQQPTSIQMGTIIMSTPFASKLSLWYLFNNNANWKSHTSQGQWQNYKIYENRLKAFVKGK